MNKYFKIFATVIFIIIIIFTIIKLTVNTSSLPDYGVTTLQHGIVTNLEAQKNFIEAYQQGESGKWQKTIYTIEGDPIFYVVQYNQEINSLKVSVDTRQDNFGAKAIIIYKCEKIKISKDFILIMTGCENSPNGEVYIP